MSIDIESQEVPLADRMSWTAKSAAKVAGVPPKAVYAAIRDGSLTSFTLPGSGMRRVRRADLEDWLASL